MDVLVFLCIFVVLVGVQYFANNPFLRSVLSYFIPFYFGVLIGRYKNIEHCIIDHQCSFLVSMVLFVIASGIFSCGGEGLSWRAARLIAGVSSVPIFFSISKSLVLPVFVSSTLVCIGQNTLVIYCLQNWCKIPNVSDWHLSMLLQFLIFGLFSVCVIAVMIVVAKVLSRNIVLKQILLGKH